MATMVVLNRLKYNLDLFNHPEEWGVETSIGGKSVIIHLYHKDESESLIKYTCHSFEEACDIYGSIAPPCKHINEIKKRVYAHLQLSEDVTKLKKPGVTCNTLMFRYIKERINDIFIAKPVITGGFNSLYFSFKEGINRTWNLPYSMDIPKVTIDCNGIEMCDDKSIDSGIILRFANAITTRFVDLISGQILYQDQYPTFLIRPEYIKDEYHQLFIDTCYSTIDQLQKNAYVLHTRPCTIVHNLIEKDEKNWRLKKS